MSASDGGMPVPHPGHRALQLRQATVEEMAAARKHDDRQLLRSRPVEHVGERNHVVLLAVDHDRVGRNRTDGEALHCRPDEHEAFGLDALGNACLHERAERETGERQRQRGAEARPRVRKGGQRIVGLAVAVVKRAPRGADAAKVEAHGDVAQAEECLRERLRDLVVERAALQWMRMRDQRQPRGRHRGRVDDDFKIAGGAGDDFPLGGARRQISRRSTILPPATCESMISSMSSRSTYVYQTASG